MVEAALQKGMEQVVITAQRFAAHKALQVEMDRTVTPVVAVAVVE